MKESSISRIKKSPGIFRRFMLVMLLVGALTIGTFAVVIIQFQENTIREDLMKTAQDQTMRADRDTYVALHEEDYAEVIKNSMGYFEEKKELLFVTLTRKNDGFSLIHTRNGMRHDFLGAEWNPLHDPPSNSSSRENPFVDTPALIVSRRADASGSDWGWIHVGLSLASYDANVRGVYRVTAIVALLTFSIGSLVAYIFARQITRPIASLREYARQVAAGDLHSRAEIHSHDEIGELTESINSMVEALSQSQARLKDSLKQQASLREKDILLREIHHRVKNNMQILSSLFRLQTRRVASDELRDVLRESEARIRSMGLLHEKLYKSESVSLINIEDYLNSLTTEIMRMNSSRRCPIAMNLSAPGVRLGLDTALPCGLIVTELVSNCLKYAFDQDSTNATIAVSINMAADGEYTLIVRDNGRGLPPDFDPSQCTSLGMRLVSMLTDQLHGTFAISGHQGTRTEIRFRESQYKNRY